jgi:Flp pilus assembly pilin Flp
MRRLTFLIAFARQRSGATSVEYALLIALVAGLSFAAWMGIGDGLKNIFEYITTVLA